MSKLSSVRTLPIVYRNVLILQAFCHELQKQLPRKSDGRVLKNQIDELENQINAIKSYSLKSPGSRRHTQLDSVGTNLWNLCVQIKRQDDNDASPARSKLLTLARLFSFIILALAQWGDHNTPGDLLRLEKLAIKTGRSCIGILHLRVPPHVQDLRGSLMLA